MSASVIEKLLFRAGAACPFLREPIELTRRLADGNVRRLGTDGLDIYTAEDHIPGANPVPDPGRGAASAPLEQADVDHLLMHCVFRHMLVPEKVLRPLWDLACDISAEFLRTEFFPDHDAKVTRILIRQSVPDSTDPRQAAEVYRALTDLFEDELEPLFSLFARDDHRYWYEPAPGGRIAEGGLMSAQPGVSGQAGSEAASPQEPPKDRASSQRLYRETLAVLLTGRWPVDEDLSGGLIKRNLFGIIPGSREEKILLRRSGKYDFSRYLRRFTSNREEQVLDLSSFDYIPYCFGLERYGNMPLIEPLEYQEPDKIEELVIAIDTSGSCSLKIVERFLAEIERILMHSDSFFRKMNVHIIQCDAVIQSHAEIRSYEEWREYIRGLKIRGRGGTDFTPVFALTEQLIKKKKLKDLKGLLYFTDGDGVYPTKKTPYETAFVFTTRESLRFKIPEWIVPLCLDMSADDVRG